MLATGVTKDHGEAVRWYRMAAEQGHADAQNNLGNAYYFGAGVSKDHGEAVRWYRMAAEQGDATAQFSLGTAYNFGEGVTKNHREAVRWYRMAAEQGAAIAQYQMGFLYANGKGVIKDYREAVRWYRMAAEQGLAEAQVNLGSRTVKAKVLSRTIVRRCVVSDGGRAGESGARKTIWATPTIYGEGVIEDDREAYIWFSIARASGSEKAANFNARKLTGVIAYHKPKSARHKKKRHAVWKRLQTDHKHQRKPLPSAQCSPPLPKQPISPPAYSKTPGAPW